jgi:G3E family GTPase
VRGDLIRVLSGLMKRQFSKGGRKFDAIIVETTGLADPGPVAQTFFVDEDVRAKTELDSVTAVVDAKHLPLRLADSKEAIEQIAFADQIILNKTDLVSEAELEEVESAIRMLNPLAPIHRAQRSNVPLETILGRHSFDLERIASLEPDFLNPAHGEPGHVHDEHCDHHHHDHAHGHDQGHDQGHDHGHDHGHEHCDHDHGHCDDHHDHGHIHDHVAESGIRGVSLTSDKPLNGNRFTAWLNNVLQTQGPDILRAKGIIDVAGENRRLVFQAVHMILEGDYQAEWTPADKRYSRMVLIGRNLDEAKLREGFESTVA